MLIFLMLAVLAQNPAAPQKLPDAPEPGDTSEEVVPPLPVATLPPATHELFERIKRRVAQVRIIERRSGTKSSIGSAFFVDAQGLAITNYHVISSIVHQPEDYTAELLSEGKESKAVPVRVLDVDVVHDLAVIRQEAPVKDWFELAPKEPPQGTRLYAMGNPHDLGTTIVEGTYNGLIQDALYDKVHFSGAINPGMSGGPTLTGEGRVVGVNVATLGNQVGFLVPVEHARALLERARTQKERGPSELLAVVGAQLLDNQQRVTERLLSAPLTTQRLGSYQVPGQWQPFLKCWGDTPHEPENPYTITSYQCSSEEDIYLSAEHRTGVVAYDHAFVTSDKLGALRFSALYTATFANDSGGVEATKEDVTNFRCREEFVSVGGMPLRAAMCLRAYKKFPGLYDLALRAATGNANTSGVQTRAGSGGVLGGQRAEPWHAATWRRSRGRSDLPRGVGGRGGAVAPPARALPRHGGPGLHQRHHSGGSQGVGLAPAHRAHARRASGGAGRGQPVTARSRCRRGRGWRRWNWRTTCAWRWGTRCCASATARTRWRTRAACPCPPSPRARRVFDRPFAFPAMLAMTVATFLGASTRRTTRRRTGARSRWRWWCQCWWRSPGRGFGAWRARWRGDSSTSGRTARSGAGARGLVARAHAARVCGLWPLAGDGAALALPLSFLFWGGLSTGTCAT